MLKIILDASAYTLDLHFDKWKIKMHFCQSRGDDLWSSDRQEKKKRVEKRKKHTYVGLNFSCEFCQSHIWTGNECKPSERGCGIILRKQTYDWTTALYISCFMPFLIYIGLNLLSKHCAGFLLKCVNVISCMYVRSFWLCQLLALNISFSRLNLYTTKNVERV